MATLTEAVFPPRAVKSLRPWNFHTLLLELLLSSGWSSSDWYSCGGGGGQKKGRQTAFVETNGYNVHNSAWSLRAARCTWKWLGMKMRHAPSAERSVFCVPVIFMSLSMKILGPSLGFRHGLEIFCSPGWGGRGEIDTSGMWCGRAGRDWKLWNNQPWQCITNLFSHDWIKGMHVECSIQKAWATMLIFIGTDG